VNLTALHFLCYGLILFTSLYDVIRGIDRTMTNEGSARKMRLNGNSSDMEFPGIDAFERDLPLGLGEREGRVSFLDSADVTPDVTSAKLSMMSSEIIESRKGSVFRPAVSVRKNLGSKTESVFRSAASATDSVPNNFRFSKSTVTRLATTPISSPVFPGFSQSEGFTDGKRRDLEESKARYEGELEAVLNLEEEDVMNKLKFAEEFYLGEYPNETESRGVFGTKTEVSAGGPYYYPSSPQIQSSSPYQQSSGVVPDRFRTGRESLSVIRNVTMRDSKRPKARPSPGP
jgi:hypothetical protein